MPLLQPRIWLTLTSFNAHTALVPCYHLPFSALLCFSLCFFHLLELFKSQAFAAMPLGQLVGSKAWHHPTMNVTSDTLHSAWREQTFRLTWGFLGRKYTRYCFERKPDCIANVNSKPTRWKDSISLVITFAEDAVAIYPENLAKAGWLHWDNVLSKSWFDFCCLDMFHRPRMLTLLGHNCIYLTQMSSNRKRIPWMRLRKKI